MTARAKFWRDLATGKDGISFDMGRVIGLAAAAVGLGLEVHSVLVRGNTFDFQQFGIGVGTMASGIGALLKLKETTEPEPK